MKKRSIIIIIAVLLLAVSIGLFVNKKERDLTNTETKTKEFFYSNEVNIVDVNVEPYGDTDITSQVLEKLNLQDLSSYNVLDIRINDLNPTVNNNNDTYKYVIDAELTLTFECDKNDPTKQLTGIKVTAAAANKTVDVLFTNGTTQETMTLNITVINRVRDDEFVVMPGEGINVKENDYLPGGKNTFVLCDANGNNISGTDGVYSPLSGLYLTVTGSGFTVQDNSEDGVYEIYYYVNNKNNGKIYANANNAPAKITLTVSKLAEYKTEKDILFDKPGATITYNVLSNDEIANYDHITFCSDQSCSNLYIIEPGTPKTYRAYKNLVVNNNGEITFEVASNYYSSKVYYRVYVNANDYVENVVEISPLEVSNTSTTINTFEEKGIGVYSNYGVTIYSELRKAIVLCNSDGSEFTPIENLNVKLDGSYVELLTEVAGTYDVYYKIVYQGKTSEVGHLAITANENEHVAVPDEVSLKIGEEIEIDALANDRLPEISEVENAVKREIKILRNGWRYTNTYSSHTEIPIEELGEDGYYRPDIDPTRPDDDAKADVLVKVDGEKIIAGLYRQGKGTIWYRVKYLDENNNALAYYDAEITLYPILNYNNETLEVVDSFDPIVVDEFKNSLSDRFNWQIGTGTSSNGTPGEDLITVKKSITSTDKINHFNVILDVQTKVSWSEVYANTTCRLQNGNSDESAKRLILYPKREDAEAILAILRAAGNADETNQVVEVSLNFFHDDWEVRSNVVYSGPRYVITEGGNFSLYCSSSIPDQGLNGEVGQKRKIQAGNAYYIDITEEYNQFDLEVEPVIPTTLTDTLANEFNFGSFLLNKDSKATYNEETKEVEWNLSELYSPSDTVVEYTVDGKKTYYHQYNLIYDINTNDEEFNNSPDKIVLVGGVMKLLYNGIDEPIEITLGVSVLNVPNPNTGNAITIILIVLLASLVLFVIFSIKKKRLD